MEKPQSKPTAYQRPTSGIFPFLPESWVPYAELMRLDRLGGFITFFLPCIFGLAYATAIATVQPSLLLLVDRSITIFLCCVLARGSSCAWNDSVDRDFDQKVERCSVRPIARGAVTRSQANTWAVVQFVMMVILAARAPVAVFKYLVAILPLGMMYPFAKRYTNYPQAVLGTTFGVGSLMSARSVHVFPMDREFLAPSICVIFVNTLWSMIYDTIYAHQDVADDIHVGVKGMAVKYQNCTKLACSIMSVPMLGLLTAIGVLTELGPLYYAFAIGGGGISLAATISFVNLKDEKNCAWWFSHGYTMFGMSVLAGFLADSLSKTVPASDFMDMSHNSSWIHTEL
ncbi:4-hydroxybenzoate polyprenyl transferase [Penicillium longicatenatum]|nr:4-hydroxybenzoate polyprenyl transferase [Penicillium longicatenatum]